MANAVPVVAVRGECDPSKLSATCTKKPEQSTCKNIRAVVMFSLYLTTCFFSSIWMKTYFVKANVNPCESEYHLRIRSLSSTNVMEFLKLVQ